MCWEAFNAFISTRWFEICFITFILVARLLLDTTSTNPEDKFILRFWTLGVLLITIVCLIFALILYWGRFIANNHPHADNPIVELRANIFESLYNYLNFNEVPRIDEVDEVYQDQFEPEEDQERRFAVVSRVVAFVVRKTFGWLTCFRTNKYSVRPISRKGKAVKKMTKAINSPMNFKLTH